MIMINRITDYLPGARRRAQPTSQPSGDAFRNQLHRSFDSIGEWVGQHPGPSLAAAFAIGGREVGRRG